MNLNTSLEDSNNLNDSNNIIDDYTRDPIQLNFFGLLAIMLPIVAIIGNWAVILSVKREKCLQTSTNFLIVSLAVADLLVGLIVMPWGIFALVRHHECELERDIGHNHDDMPKYMSCMLH